MTNRAHDALMDQGVVALLFGPSNGTPYKVYAAQAAQSSIGLGLFLLISIPARLIHFLLITVLAHYALRGAASGRDETELGSFKDPRSHGAFYTPGLQRLRKNSGSFILQDEPRSPLSPDRYKTLTHSTPREVPPVLGHQCSNYRQLCRDRTDRP